MSELKWTYDLPAIEGPYWWRQNAESPVFYMAVKEHWRSLCAWTTFDRPDETIWSPWYRANMPLADLGGEWLEIRRPTQ